MSESVITERRPRISVTLIGGETIQLLHKREVDFFEEAKAKYLGEYSFPMANDVRTVDSILMQEVQLFRYRWYVMAGMDYEGVDIDSKEEEGLRKAIKEVGLQLRQDQESLGLTKAQRDKQTVDSVGGYITQLQQAAKAHGVNRERQLGKALELTKELFALCGAFMRSNEAERRKLGFDGPDDIINWVLDYMKPEFDSIDEHFRQNEARFYRRQL